MAKGRLLNSQSTAIDLIEDLIEGRSTDGLAPTISWRTISDKIKEKHNVNDPRFDWMNIRKILQFYMNEKLIARTDDLTVEEYVRL